MPNATMPIPGAELGLASIFKTAGALFLILAFIFIGVWLLKRYGPALGVGGMKKAGLELLGQLPLGPKRGLAVVRIQDKTLVLGVTEHQINLVTELDAPVSADKADQEGEPAGDGKKPFSSFFEEK